MVETEAAPTDAEKLTKVLEEAVREAPRRIAPERVRELEQTVFCGPPWPIVFRTDGSNFRCSVARKRIDVYYAGMLSLWAVARATVLICDEAAKQQAAASTEHGEDVPYHARIELSTEPGAPAHTALRLMEAARSLIGDSRTAWPHGLPCPQVDAEIQSEEWRVNNVFLGACAWILLHEIGHIDREHSDSPIPEVTKEQETEADMWATGWVLGQAPGDLTREFRLLAFVVGLVWIVQSDQVTGASPDYPRGFDRLIRQMGGLDIPEMSPGLQLAGYAIKAFFLPGDDAPVCDTPYDMFFGYLIAAARAER